MKIPHPLICSALAAWVSSASAQVIPGRYIVMLQPGQDPHGVAATHGVKPDHVYDTAVQGFADTLSEARLEALRRDRRVLVVEPDRQVHVLGHLVTAGTITAATVTSTGDLVPTGVDRIDAELNPCTDASAVGIAIIDTGICLTHPDLYVAGGISYVTGIASANDDNGHGSHVAGIAAAKINALGVRGVAPNAKLFAVKVLNNTGSGTLSAVISGVNWVTKNAILKGIKVANMSLGFTATSTTLNSAITKSVNAGVTYVVAAGNNGVDAATFSPANHPSVIAVSAVADEDGDCGADGLATYYGADDSFATFSNYGLVVDIAAPGVTIYSTFMNSGYATMSGTSMAAPHVTGCAALYLVHHPTATPATVRTALLSLATPQSPVEPWLDTTTNRWRGGFSGDRDLYHEPLADAAGL
ncbi:MAG: S8 family peptidase [Verrucomicrobia bacterium]|nr:S8 family peptidase [Verrucomicrobiota bacterium]